MSSGEQEHNLGRLTPYNVYPNLETEIVDQFLDEFEATKESIYNGILQDKENSFLFRKLIKNSLSKVDWGWIQKKYPERVGWYVQDN